jgi:hypothetical protein
MSTTPNTVGARPKQLLTSIAASFVLANLFIKAAAIRRAESRRAR